MRLARCLLPPPFAERSFSHSLDRLRSHEQPRSGHSKLDIRRTRRHYKRCFGPPLRGEVMRG
jgi:hypothetical protein